MFWAAVPSWVFIEIQNFYFINSGYRGSEQPFFLALTLSIISKLLLHDAFLPDHLLGSLIVDPF